MVGLDDWRFPVEFTAIEGDNVLVKWTQVTPGKKADGSPYTQSGYSHLVYAGDGRFSYEEDCYNMVHVLEDLSAERMASDRADEPAARATPCATSRARFLEAVERVGAACRCRAARSAPACECLSEPCRLLELGARR